MTTTTESKTTQLIEQLNDTQRSNEKLIAQLISNQKILENKIDIVINDINYLKNKSTTAVDKIKTYNFDTLFKFSVDLDSELNTLARDVKQFNELGIEHIKRIIDRKTSKLANFKYDIECSNLSMELVNYNLLIAHYHILKYKLNNIVSDVEIIEARN